MACTEGLSLEKRFVHFCAEFLRVYLLGQFRPKIKRYFLASVKGIDFRVLFLVLLYEKLLR